MNSKIFFSALFFSFLILLIAGCEQPVPDDAMFCKSKEVFLLEKPYDPKSAIIVMYRGDEVKLLGDTIYHFTIDSTLKKDSTDFFVKVSGKRGVVGWVNKKDLQHERIKINKFPKNSNKLLKPKDNKDSLAISNDSTLNFMTFGNFISDAESGVRLHAVIDSVSSDQRVFKIYFSGNDACKKEISGKALLEKYEIIYQNNNCNLKFIFEKNQLFIEESGTDCMEKECRIKHKLFPIPTN
jgi:hypothetical protein